MALLNKFASRQFRLMISQLRFSSQMIVPDHPEIKMSEEDRNWNYPKLGDRDVVGYGTNGDPAYIDDPMHPFPAIRFRENSADFDALRKKEKLDWKNLSLEEKRKLYRMNFCRTFAELYSPTGVWRSYLGALAFLFGSLFLWNTYIFHHVYHGHGPLSKIPKEAWDPDTIADTMEIMVNLKSNPMFGYARWYDYEKDQWKE